MCGLVGMVTLANNGFYHQDLEIMEQMLYVDALRGADSTGVFCVDRRGGIEGIKHASHPINTFSSAAWGTLKQNAIKSGKILVGHNRKATHGNVNNANAHPFYEKHIILVHNGTLWDHKNKLAERDVDSHAFAAKLSETDPANVPELLAETGGAFAFIWWDRNQKKLFISRNKERPLTLIRYNNKIVFASEAWMARGVILRNEKSITFDEKRTDCFKQFEVLPEKLYSYDMDGNQEVVDWPAKKAQVPVVTPTTTGTGNNAHRGTTKTTASDSRIVTLYPSNNPFPKDRSSPFNSGDLIVARADRIQDVGATGGRRLRFLGKVHQIGKPEWDVNGLLPTEVDIGDAQDWVGKFVMGRVMSVNGHLAAGPSLMIAHVTKAGDQIASHNKMKMFVPEWEWVQEHCLCKHCQGRALPYDWPFTNVKFDQLQNVEVICADCVENRIENTEVKEKFVADRIASLDSWVPGSEKSAIGTEQANRVNGPTTLQ